MIRRLFSITCIACILALPLVVSAQAGGELLIRNATVMTATRGTLANTDILVRDGKIVRIGKNITAGSGARVIDATGK